MRRTLILLSMGWALLSGGLAAEPASGAGVSEVDAQAVRDVIEAQLEAFAADDAARAFSYASPAIRRQFGGADAFLAMVRQGYPMVIRPAARSYSRPEAESDPQALQQTVLLRDAQGQTWRALYQLQRQTDRTWRIDGCRIVPDDGRSST
jgi:hypothetical protein